MTSFWLGLLCVLSFSVTSGTCRIVQMGVSGCGGRLYPGLGCFSNDPPFTNSAPWLPRSPAEVGTTFYLYTRHNPIQAQLIDPLLSSTLRSSHFNASQPLKVLVHGFMQNGHTGFLLNMTRAFLSVSPVNVLVVGWGEGAGLPYSQAVANTRVVGAEISRLLGIMVRQFGLSLDNVHLVGHSLGAHVTGYAGARMPGIARITGLDPAQPSFHGYAPEVRLDPTDAHFVDVIHTDGVLYNTVRGYGMIEPVGHVDFYPNGGRDQPGCAGDRSVLDFVQDAISGGISQAEYDLSCSHERSTALFTNSILLDSGPCSFKAFPCESEAAFLRGECLHCGNRPCPEMGLHAALSHGARGRFFLNTTAQQPYCGFHHFVKVYLPTPMEVDGVLEVRLRGTGGRHTDRVDVSRHSASDNFHSGLLMSAGDIGEVTGVDVFYRESTGWNPWSSQPVTLARVEVSCPMRYPTKYFCQQTMNVQPNRELSLDGGAFTESSCPLPASSTTANL